jgi:hypothetical protein
MRAPARSRVHGASVHCHYHLKSGDRGSCRRMSFNTYYHFQSKFGGFPTSSRRLGLGKWRRLPDPSI